MLIEVTWVRIDTPGPLAVKCAPPRERVVEDSLQLFDAQRIENFLRALQGKRISKSANWFADHMHDTCVVGPGMHDFRIVKVEVGYRRDGKVVFDNISTRVVFGNGVVAVAEPKEVPPVPISRVRILGDWLIEEVAGATGKVGQERMYTNIPVSIVFENEGRRHFLFDDAEEERMSAAGVMK